MQKILPKSLPFLEEKKPQQKLKQVEIHVCDHCNLNCKSCDHFSPLSSPNFVNNNLFYRQMNRMHEIFNDDIEEILLLGGEPLLNRNLHNLITFTSKLFSKTKVKIITNGLLILLQNDKFWKSVKRKNVEIVITKYPISLDFNAIENKLNENNVHFSYFGNTGKTKKTSYKIPIDISGAQDPEWNFSHCFYSNYCVQLRDGKLFTCPTAAYISIFNKKFKKNLQISKNDFIDIFDPISKEEIFLRLSRSIPFCRFCNVKERLFELEWGISKEEINEWT